MKRTFKPATAIAAMVLALSLFAACDDDDDSSSSYTYTSTYDFSSYTKATEAGSWYWAPTPFRTSQAVFTLEAMV